MILQLDPPLPLITPKGRALAHFLIDYGPEHHLLWTCFLNAGGECWTFSNPEIRLEANFTMGRTHERRNDKIGIAPCTVGQQPVGSRQWQGLQEPEVQGLA